MEKNITTDNKGVGDPNLSSYNTTLQLRTTAIRRKDGMVQKYCGLQLPESGKPKSVVPTTQQTIPAAHNTTLQLRTTAIRRKDGMVQKYCGLQLPESGRSISVVPTRPQTIPAAHKSSGACVSYEKLEYPLRRCRLCNATMWKEERKAAATDANLIFSICCQEGKIKLPMFEETPEPLKQLLEGSNVQCVDFRQKIRVYNSVFSFTSFGARIDEKINQFHGPYTFCISGHNYHRIGSLLPEGGDPPRYAQLYFSDPNSELQNRMGCMNLTSKDVDQSIVSKLMKMLHSTSAVAKAFTMAREWATSNGSMEFKLKLIGERRPNERQYNLPTIPEVATLIVGDFGQSTALRDVYIQNKSNHPQRISELHL